MGRRLFAVALLGLSLAATPSAQSVFGDPVVGPQRILVVLATWGPQPFARDNVRRVVFDEADAFYRAASYGKASLTGVVTPWLKAFEGPAACTLLSLRAAGSAAASAAGYDPAAYDRVIYLHPAAGCPWSGVTFATAVYLNGALNRHLVAHELGHSYGLAHANTTSCRRHGCPAVEYGDPYDTMGEGDGDFGAESKVKLGWLTRVAKPSSSGVYGLDPLERPSAGNQAIVLTTAGDEYWIEYRAQRGGPRAGPGVLLRVSPSPDLRGPETDAARNLLLANPSGRGHPELRTGERFVDPGAFTLTVLRPMSGHARLRFSWTDKVAPKAPHLMSSVVGGNLQLTLESAKEDGSGVANYIVTLDGGAVHRVANDATDEPVIVGRPLPGTHTLRVVAVDRAGNRSAPAVRRFRVR